MKKIVRRQILKFLIILIPFLLIGIFIFINTTNTSKFTSSFENKDEYIYINFVDKQLNQIFYQYDVKNKIRKMLLKEKITEYPTAIYSKSTNEVFFTYKTSNKTSQVFRKNLNTNETIQITSNFSHVDFLELDEEKRLLFMRVLMDKNDRNFQLAILDLKNNKTYKWDNTDSDITVHSIDYAPNNKQILLVTNSVKKEYEKIKQANVEGKKPDPPTYNLSIYGTDGKKIKDVTTINTFLTGASLSSDGKEILISYFNNQEELMSNIATIDVETQEETLLLTDLDSAVRDPEFNEYNSGFYFLANKDKGIVLNDEKPNKVTLNYYDIESKKIIEILSSEEDGEIVNFRLEK
jgi:hypothetical protein